MRWLIFTVVDAVLCSCTINVHHFDHGFVSADEQAPVTNETRHVGEVSSRRLGHSRVNQSRAATRGGTYSNFYISTRPVEGAKVTLISDGRSNDISRVFSDVTPITYRMRPGTVRPIGPESCNRTIILKIEKIGYNSTVMPHKVFCSTNKQTAENSQNEVIGTILISQGVTPP